MFNWNASTGDLPPDKRVRRLKKMKKNRVFVFLMALVVALTLSFSVCAEGAETAAQAETTVQEAASEKEEAPAEEEALAEEAPAQEEAPAAETAPAEEAAESSGSNLLVNIVVFAIALGIALLIFYNTKKDK